MPDCYVTLVKEYLENENYVVSTEIRYEVKKDKNGKEKTSWGDIDIVAVKVKDDQSIELVVGEVKSIDATESLIAKIYEKKFDNPYLNEKGEKMFGVSLWRERKKYLYCWDCSSSKTRECAKEKGIEIKSFKEIVNSMIGFLQKSPEKRYLYNKDNPNLMLLQFLKDKHLIKLPNSDKIIAEKSE